MSERRKLSFDGFDLSPSGITVVYALYAAVIALGTIVLRAIDPHGMSLSLDAPWHSHGSLLTGLGRVWFIFAWGGGVTLIVGLIQAMHHTPRDREPLDTLFKGWWISLNAGFFEEIIFRWLMFFSYMVLIQWLNVITFHLTQWLYVHAFIPWENWLTLGHLKPQLLGMGWVLGAAIVSSNSSFEKGHEHLGFFGKINAGFLGMVMFWLMFNYGLWTAIAAHVIYDVCVFTARAATDAMRPRDYGNDLARAIAAVFQRR